jgi:hypothetical protein
VGWADRQEGGALYFFRDGEVQLVEAPERVTCIRHSFVSADGRVTLGKAIKGGESLFYIYRNGGFEFPRIPADVSYTELPSVSSDGSAVLGWLVRSSEVHLYTYSGGSIQILNSLPVAERYSISQFAGRKVLVIRENEGRTELIELVFEGIEELLHSSSAQEVHISSNMERAIGTVGDQIVVWQGQYQKPCLLEFENLSDYKLSTHAKALSANGRHVAFEVLLEKTLDVEREATKKVEETLFPVGLTRQIHGYVWNIRTQEVQRLIPLRPEVDTVIQVNHISNSIAVGASGTPNGSICACIWYLGADKVQGLGFLQETREHRTYVSHHSVAYASTADGSVVVGESSRPSLPKQFRPNIAFIWTARSGMQVLPSLNETSCSIASGISDLGHYVVGISGEIPCIWISKSHKWVALPLNHHDACPFSNRGWDRTSVELSEGYCSRDQ